MRQNKKIKKIKKNFFIKKIFKQLYIKFYSKNLKVFDIVLKHYHIFKFQYLIVTYYIYYNQFNI